MLLAIEATTHRTALIQMNALFASLQQRGVCGGVVGFALQFSKSISICPKNVLFFGQIETQ